MGACIASMPGAVGTILLLTVFFFTAPVRADDGLPPTLDASVAHGLDFLNSQQNPDGSFGLRQKPAITGLALMSFLASGHTADVGKYGATVRGAVDYLLSCSLPDGSFNREHDDKPMYAQGIATLALAEAYGVEESEDRRREIAGVLARSVALILKAQAIKKAEPFAGGWRYNADSADSDLSLSGWNALALRACQDDGLRVSKENVKRAGQFVLNCYDQNGRGFSYQPHNPATPGCTGIAVLCLHLLDDPSNRFAATAQARAGARYLPLHLVGPATPYPYYALYYTTQAAWQVGGSTWTTVSKSNFDRLLKLQQPDGGWPETNEGPGRAYTTCMSLLSLSVPYQLLPIHQR